MLDTSWATVLSLASALLAGCGPMPCFGDSCNCYGDPEAPNANAGCADCTPPATCDRLAHRAKECGIAPQGSLEACEQRIRAEHSCQEGIGSTSCVVISVACADGDFACLAELVTSGATSCSEGVVTSADGTEGTAPCASGRCLFGECVD